ncbi:hypothetical protein niasHT_037299 [Heterodera trifolii]|uniref:Uncharacterized protein n=1 Tax=Heterodera trifolii TaxID=157864 RepID=A0ABD2J0T1_9BILA
MPMMLIRFKFACPILLAILAIIQICSCLDKSKAVGPCLNGSRCPAGNFCAADNQCFPKKDGKKKVVAQRDVVQQGKQKDVVVQQQQGKQKDNIGPCVNGLCPNGYECRDDTCFKVKAPAGAPKSIGPCVNNKCPDGYSCDQAEYKCISH